MSDATGAKVIFISWSLARGKEVAMALKKELGQFFERINRGKLEFFCTATDIAAGRLWFQEVGDKLDRADAAIICLTPEGLDSKWIYFEAGAVARGGSGVTAGQTFRENVFPYLMDVRPGDVDGPLAWYQYSFATREGTWSLICALARIAFGGNDDGLSEGHYVEDYRETWTRLERCLSEIRSKPLRDIFPDAWRAFARKTFRENVQDCMNQRWVERFVAANETLAQMVSCEKALGADSGGHEQRKALRALIEDLDAYRMILHGFFLREQKFGLKADGTLDLPAGFVEATGKRLESIRQRAQELFGHESCP